MEKIGTGPIQSVSRAVAILRCFYDREELGLQEISQLVGLHKSTTATLLATLKNEQLLEQNPKNGKYRLGMEAFFLGSSTKINIHTIIRPYLVELNEKFHETVNLTVPNGTDVVYVDKMESEYSMRTCTRIGQRLPFYCTANGKVIFAYYSQEKLSECLSTLQMIPFTSNTISDPESLLKVLAQVRDQGFACDSGELELGLCCYAAPVFDGNGTPVAAISLSGPQSRMDSAAKDEMIRTLKTYAEKITHTLSRSAPAFIGELS